MGVYNFIFQNKFLVYKISKNKFQKLFLKIYFSELF